MMLLPSIRIKATFRIYHRSAFDHELIDFVSILLTKCINLTVIAETIEDMHFGEYVRYNRAEILLLTRYLS